MDPSNHAGALQCKRRHPKKIKPEWGDCGVCLLVPGSQLSIACVGRMRPKQRLHRTPRFESKKPPPRSSGTFSSRPPSRNGSNRIPSEKHRSHRDSHSSRRGTNFRATEYNLVDNSDCVGAPAIFEPSQKAALRAWLTSVCMFDAAGRMLGLVFSRKSPVLMLSDLFRIQEFPLMCFGFGGQV